MKLNNWVLIIGGFLVSQAIGCSSTPLINEGIYDVAITYDTENWPNTLAGETVHRTWIIGSDDHGYSLRVAGYSSSFSGSEAALSDGTRYVRFRESVANECADQPYSTAFHANVFPLHGEGSSEFFGDGIVGVLLCGETDIVDVITFESYQYEEF